MVGTVVLAALAGCAYQDPFSLPNLMPRGTASTVPVYPGYGVGYGYGYGYPNGYRPGYGYRYADPYYAAQGPYPYAYGYGYNPYPRYLVVPRVGNGGNQGVAPTVPPRAVPAPAPVVQQPARVRPEPRRARPSDATTPQGPRAGRGRQSMTGGDVTLSRPTQEP